MKYRQNQQVKVFYMGRWKSGKIIKAFDKQPFSEQIYLVEVRAHNFNTELVKIAESDIQSLS